MPTIRVDKCQGLTSPRRGRTNGVQPASPASCDPDVHTNFTTTTAERNVEGVGSARLRKLRLY